MFIICLFYIGMLEYGYNVNWGMWEVSSLDCVSDVWKCVVFVKIIIICMLKF